MRSERIGFVFQSFHLVPRPTAAENIALPMVLAGLPAAERVQRVQRALRDYGWNTARRPPARRALRRAAPARGHCPRHHHAPAMILADEPTGNLDRSTGEEVVRLLEGLNAQGVTLIVVTHDAALGARAASC